MSTGAPRPENPELLAAIISHPDEDTPRFMYADWLQENGDPERAEFIRLHIEWDRRPPGAPPDEELKRSLIAALEAIESRERWPPRHRRWGDCAYERGFIAAAECDFDWDAITDLSESVCGSAPIRVLYESHPHQRRPFDAKEWERFSTIVGRVPALTGFGAELDYNSGLAPHWQRYLRSPAASALRLLDFNYSRGFDSCELVAELTNLTNLLVLDLTVCCRFEDGQLALLADAAHLRSLVALRLAANDEYRGGISADGITRLVESRYLTSLRQLTLNNHEDLNDTAVFRLLEWERVGQLDVLELSCRDITDAGGIGIARAPELRNLRRLVLDGTRLAPETIAAVLGSHHLRGLTEFYLSPPPASLPVDLLIRLRERFPNYANMRFDPPAVCVEDRIRARYRLMTHPCGDGTYRGRDQAYGDGGFSEPPLHDEYAIL
jgi:uncharacterized protein (TIGR02996 family)